MLSSLRRCPAALKQPSLALRFSTSTRTSISNPISIKSRSIVENQILRATGRSISQRSFLHTSLPRSQLASEAYAPDAEHDGSAAGTPKNMGLITKFRQLGEMGLVDPVIVKTLTQKMGFEDMTQVQSLTISEAMKGIDVIAQAKTGTGKTVAFVLPILQRILNSDPSLRKPQVFRGRGNNGRSDIRAIIISPTRELAEQIAVETRKLVQGTGVSVQVAVGGTQKNAHLRAIDREGCHILVATPGRLADLLSDPRSGVRAPKLDALTLDEADRLMDDGFWPQIQDIQTYLPPTEERDRQTLMFSATISREVAGLARQTLKPDFHYVQTVQDNEAPTHERIPQKLVMTNGVENVTPALAELCLKANAASKEDPSKLPFKAIVYFNSTAEAELTHKVFLGLKDQGRSAERGSPMSLFWSTKIYGISSRLTQAQRQRAADLFREAKSAILMSSDVTARGMDFPNVTHVIQIGIPQTHDTYIHRVGRTGRAGKEGEAWSIMPERFARNGHFHDVLGRLPLVPDNSLENATFDLANAEENGDYTSPMNVVALLREAYQSVDIQDIEQSHRGQLGTLSRLQGNKSWLGPSISRTAKVLWGLPEAPHVSGETLTKLGLRELASQFGQQRRSRMGSFGGGGGGFNDFSEGRDGFGRGGRGRGQGRDFNDRGRNFNDRGRDFRDRGRDFKDRGRPQFGFPDRQGSYGRPSRNDREGGVDGFMRG